MISSRGVSVQVAKLETESTEISPLLAGFFLPGVYALWQISINHNEQAHIMLVPDLSTDFEQLPRLTSSQA